MSDPSPFGKFRWMQAEHERMVQRVRKHQSLFDAWFIAVGILSLSGLGVVTYVGYKVRTHFHIL